MVKIAFHDNQLCERGTTIALYDYAYYNKYLLGNESIILYDGNDHRNIDSVINKFNKEFKLFPYNKWNNDVNKILTNEKCDILYMIKAGDWDGKIADPKICKTVIHCVFTTNKKHGDVYAKISPWVSDNNYNCVPHMINLPNNNENMREKLSIPKEAIVYGRYGGCDEFNIRYVHKVVYNVAKENKNIYFLFANTNKFCESLPNIIHIDRLIDLNEKVEFINTCDAMIWAREGGETFGLSIGEFSSKNKPIIATKKIRYTNAMAHVHILKDKGLWYEDENSLKNILLNFDKNNKNDWNAYQDYTPEKVIKIFDEVFIQPCIVSY